MEQLKKRNPVTEWEKFYDLVNRTFPKLNASMFLPFNSEEQLEGKA
jgi:hypothetical protein